MPLNREEAEIIRNCMRRMDRTGQFLKGVETDDNDWWDKKPGYYASKEIVEFMRGSHGVYFDTWVCGALSSLLQGDLKLGLSLSEPQYPDPKWDEVEVGDFVIYVGPDVSWHGFSGEVDKIANGLASCTGKRYHKGAGAWQYDSHQDVLFAVSHLFKLGRA